ncbi:hypothetical protein [Formosa algae]|uniref:hypothetical protein n=1 Tax=Formosa algae TaxID=225843 RepID=UPI000CCEBA54|nr:hypothetical protein [Formosa algae]PNW27560.1 hypothetical protein BKP44_12145 [Formosa algae]
MRFLESLNWLENYKTENRLIVTEENSGNKVGSIVFTPSKGINFKTSISQLRYDENSVLL